MSTLKSYEKVLGPIAVLVLSVAIWSAAVHWTHTIIFPSPSQVVAGASELATNGTLTRDVRDSLARVAEGYLSAVIVGVPIGLLLGWYPLAGKAFHPVIEMLRPISPLAWIPVAIIWFGVGNRAAVFLIFLASLFPIVVAVTNSVRSVPSIYRNAGQNFGLSPGALLARVILPAALPKILIGLRLALGVAWLVVVAAEMIAVDSGLGYLVIDSRNAGKRYDLVIAAMVLIGIVGLTLDTVLRRLERLRSIRWGFAIE